jgi:hypothetical protein
LGFFFSTILSRLYVCGTAAEVPPSPGLISPSSLTWYINIAISSSSCTSSIPHQLYVSLLHRLLTRGHLDKLEILVAIESSRRHWGMLPVRLGWWWRGGVYIFSSSKKITIVASATCKIQMKGCDLNSFFAKN